MKMSRLPAPCHFVPSLPHALLRTLPPAWVEADSGLAGLGRFEASSYFSVYLWFDRKLTRERFWARLDAAHSLNLDFYDFSNIYPGWQERPSLIGSNVIYAQRAPGLSDEEVVERTLEELAENVPGVRRARLRQSAVHRIPMAIPCPLVGSERLRLPVRTPIDGLWLAGDWLRTGLRRSIGRAPWPSRTASWGRSPPCSGGPPAPCGEASAEHDATPFSRRTSQRMTPARRTRPGDEIAGIRAETGRSLRRLAASAAAGAGDHRR